jgi:hypothetical protein
MRSTFKHWKYSENKVMSSLPMVEYAQVNDIRVLVVYGV